MKANKQTQELEQAITLIERYYNNLINYFKHFNTELLDDELLDMLEKTVDKAKAWDIFRAKCAKGAKVGASNLSKKERIDRARHASLSKTNKAQKEKALKKVRH